MSKQVTNNVRKELVYFYSQSCGLMLIELERVNGEHMEFSVPGIFWTRASKQERADVHRIQELLDEETQDVLSIV